MSKKKMANKQTLNTLKRDDKDNINEAECHSLNHASKDQNNLKENQEKKIDLDSKIEKMEEELAKEQEKNKELYDKYLRIHAEFENFKKRKEKEKEDFCKYAVERQIKALLPVIDHFELAIQSSEESKDFKIFFEGINLIYKQLKDILAKEGVVHATSLGEKFDPIVHEAIMQKETKEHENNIIIEEHQKGYFLNERLIRPARVTVAKNTQK